MKCAVQWALESGYRHIDTAYNYQNEGAIGEVIQEWITSGKLKREELFVTTKVSSNVNKDLAILLFHSLLIALNFFTSYR